MRVTCDCTYRKDKAMFYNNLLFFLQSFNNPITLRISFCLSSTNARRVRDRTATLRAHIFSLVAENKRRPRRGVVRHSPSLSKILTTPFLCIYATTCYTTRDKQQRRERLAQVASLPNGTKEWRRIRCFSTQCERRHKRKKCLLFRIITRKMARRSEPANGAIRSSSRVAQRFSRNFSPK